MWHQPCGQAQVAWTLHTNGLVCICMRDWSMCMLSRISRQKLLRRIRREIDTLRSLDGCASAIMFEGAYESDQFVYLVMDVCHGGDLETLFKVCKPFESRQPALGVSAAHRLPDLTTMHGLTSIACLGCLYRTQQSWILPPYMHSHQWPHAT